MKNICIILPKSCIQIIVRKRFYPLNGQITISTFIIRDLGLLSVMTPCCEKWKTLEKILDRYSTFSKSGIFGFAPCSDLDREHVHIVNLKLHIFFKKMTLIMSLVIVFGPRLKNKGAYRITLVRVSVHPEWDLRNCSIDFSKTILFW